MEAAAAKPQAVKDLSENGVEVLKLAAGARGLDLGTLLDALGRRQWTYLLVEGGAKVLESFVLGGLADELMVFVSPRHVGRPERGLPRFDIARVRDRVKMAEVEERRFGDDVMMRFVRRESPGSQVPKCPTTRRRTQ
jgi:riboflavin biosynthesis pyrimidine reductase